MAQPASFTILEKSIGVSFRNKDLLAQALTHRSAVRESRARGHYERLEFLGDAVLELVVTEHLYNLSDKPEGELTNWRSALVKGEQLAVVAQELKLGDYLYMSKGEEASGGRTKPSTLANALEALIGAMYLDQGFEAASAFCNNFILVRLQQLLAAGKDRDEKSLFQEKAQEILGITPHYEVISETGPDHEKEFRVSVSVKGRAMGYGEGKSKKEAEQRAAEEALGKLETRSP